MRVGSGPVRSIVCSKSCQTSSLTGRSCVSISRGLTSLVGFFFVARQMDLLHFVERIGIDIREWVPSLVLRGNEDIVDVKKKAAASSRDNLRDELNLRIRTLREGEICRRIFQEHLADQAPSAPHRCAHRHARASRLYTAEAGGRERSLCHG